MAPRCSNLETGKAFSVTLKSGDLALTPGSWVAYLSDSSLGAFDVRKVSRYEFIAHLRQKHDIIHLKNSPGGTISPKKPKP